MTMLDGDLIEGGAYVRFVRRLPGPLARVWAYLTDGEKMAEWIGPGRVEPRVGGAVDIQNGHIVGEVTEWAPPHRFAHTWLVEAAPGSRERLASLVTYELAQEGEDVRLTLTHGKVLAGYHVLTLSGWNGLLGALAARLAGRAPAPMMENFQRVFPLYQEKFAEKLAYGVYDADGTRVTFTRFLMAPPEKVWAYVAEADKRAAWFYGGDVELRVGGKVAMSADVQGVVTAYEPPRLFAFTWHHESWDSSGSDVRIELTPAGPGGTLLTLTHARMIGADRLHNAVGWHAHLVRLGAAVDGQEADGVAIERAVRPAYEKMLG